MIMLIVGVVVLVSIALMAALQLRGDRHDRRLFPPPGRMVDIGGRSLHARVAGSGTPAVVFESGISASSVSWTVLQPRIAQLTTTVSYDRAGLGWSDPVSGHFDAERLVADLELLLRNLSIAPPYILVGHSYGALLVRLYAERNPGQIAGLVLVDPVLGSEWAQPDAGHVRSLKAACMLSSWGAVLARLGVVRFATAPLLRESTVLPMLIGKASAGPAAGVIDRSTGEIRKLPRESWPVVRALWCRPGSFRGMARHLRALPSSFEHLRNAAFDFPIVVISADNLTPEGLAEHRAIAALSHQGEHVLAEGSGHWVHFDAPDVIAAAIRRVLGAGVCDANNTRG
ncbi:MAG TPA: alpha/beta hydrolase [Bryobacteraceae bacterium]|jgi:pimeloyl-ACP methyl ester carboxylesterase